MILDAAMILAQFILFTLSILASVEGLTPQEKETSLDFAVRLGFSFLGCLVLFGLLAFWRFA